MEKTNSKKLLFRICIGLAATIVALIAVLWIIDLVEQGNNKYEEEVIDYLFYPADFKENIYEDEDYQELMRGNYLSYCDSDTNITYGIVRGQTSQYSADVSYMVEHIYAIIEGNHEAYNACFSDAYYASGRKPKEPFTMQKLYNILINRMSVETVSDTTGNYTKYVYAVTYQIYENNGTFRRDIGDGAKTQYIVLTDRTGELLIDSIATIRGQGKPA